MAKTLASKLIEAHLVEGDSRPGEEIGLRIDQTLTQDATGTLVMLELEAMGLDRVQTELSAQYVDHNLIQEDFRNPDDHRFLRSACRKFGVWFSRPGNGVSHPVHMERFGRPGRTLLGSDSHTGAAGSLGMLAMGAGGMEVALAMAGKPFYVKTPEVFGVRLTGKLPEWVSAKDVILELLRRHGVSGAVNCVLEFYGPGLSCLEAMDRHVIANMGTELGATATIFPADEQVRVFLSAQGRAEAFEEWGPDEGAVYDREEEIDLSELEPMIAMPSSPGNVRPVREVAGEPITQAYIGSSANPGYRDFAVAAEMVKDRFVHPEVSLEINPSSRQVLRNLIHDGHLESLVSAGARIHQAGCNGCIGMGQAPATGRISLRTVPRNFPGRSGTREDAVCLVSPETAAASALRGVITDPRDLDMSYPWVCDPRAPLRVEDLLEPPAPPEESVELEKGPNIAEMPDFDPLPERLELKVLLALGDDVSTDEIMPAGAEVLPYRSNIPEISAFCFSVVDSAYPGTARDCAGAGDGHAIVAGDNYGQGSSREHAALAPRYLGLRVVVAKSYARIHWQNLVNFGVLPLEFADGESADQVEKGDRMVLKDLPGLLEKGEGIVLVEGKGEVRVRHGLSPRQRDVVRKGGLVQTMRRELDRDQ